MSCMMVANRCFGRCFVAMFANIVALDCLASTEAQRLEFGLHGVLCCESLCLGSEADQSPS
ncbi:unnamed protein product [Ectocarpus sp. CCAP 1310/34]|nr:unnamed protein product [Ectocarpus sp. CCAP 1310/34]